MSEIAKSSDPYRSASLAVVAETRERSFCPWCSHRRGLIGRFDPALSRCCWAPNREAHGSRQYCEHVNKGDCEGYTPSVLTRAARRIGRRSPVLIADDR